MTDRPPRVFVSYAREDELDVARVLRHARLREKRGDIEIWRDDRISPGDEWHASIDGALDHVDVAVFFLSANFCASEYIHDVELPRLTSRARVGAVKIIPVLLGDCDWQAIDDLSRYQAFPRDQQSLRSLTPAEFDRRAVQLIHALVKGRESPPTRESPLPRSPSPESSPTTTGADTQESISLSRLSVGFALAVLSAAFWGFGNVATRWTAERFPASSFDVAFLKYLAAAVLLILAGIGLSSNRHESVLGVARGLLTPLGLAAAVAKGLNTYLWILAVTWVGAGTVAALENLHVVWTTLVLVILLGRRIPSSWIAGASVVLLGAGLVTSVLVEGPAFSDPKGLALGVASGLAFSLFTVLWSQFDHPRNLAQRAIEMGALLLVAGVALMPIHAVVNAVWLQNSYVPFSNIGGVDAVVQGINGLVGIGGTYFLANESLSMMRSVRSSSSLLLSIGMSFAVPFTLIGEALFLRVATESYQWVGAVLFVAGFAAVRRELLARRDEDITMTAPSMTSGSG